MDKIMFYGANQNIFAKAKELRLNMTPTETKLWEELKCNKLHGFRFKPQHPISQFIADFYCHKAKLIIEIDGEIHNFSERKEYDDGRTYEMEKFGLKVIRFTNDDVIVNIEKVLVAIKLHLPSAHPLIP